MDSEPTFDNRQRNTLIGLGAGVALAAIIVVVALVSTSSDSKSSSTTTTTSVPTTLASTTSSSSTTIGSSTSDGSTTTVNAATTTVTASTTAPAGPALSVAGRILKPPAGGDLQAPIDPGTGCLSLTDTGYDAACGVAHTSNGDLIWLTEKKQAAPNGTRAYVFSVQGSTATIRLAAIDDGAVLFRGISARVADVTGDGKDEIVFGFRSVGTGNYLELDIVDGTAAVIGHRSLDHGVAVVAAGRIDDYSAVFAPGDPTCCPTQSEHTTIQSVGGVLHVASVEKIPIASMPPGNI